MTNNTATKSDEQAAEAGYPHCGVCNSGKGMHSIDCPNAPHSIERVMNDPAEIRAMSEDVYKTGYAFGHLAGQRHKARSILGWLEQEGERWMPRAVFVQFMEALKREFGE